MDAAIVAAVIGRSHDRFGWMRGSTLLRHLPARRGIVRHGCRDRRLRPALDAEEPEAHRTPVVFGAIATIRSAGHNPRDLVTVEIDLAEV